MPRKPQQKNTSSNSSSMESSATAGGRVPETTSKSTSKVTAMKSNPPLAVADMAKHQKHLPENSNTTPARSPKRKSSPIEIIETPTNKKKRAHAQSTDTATHPEPKKALSASEGSQGKMQALESRLAKQKKEIQSMADELKDLQKSLRASGSNQAESAKETRADLKNEIQNAKDANAKLENEIRVAKDTNARLQKEVQAVKSKNKQKDDRISNLLHENEQQDEDIERLQKIVDQNRKKQACVTDEETSDTIQQLQERVEELLNENEEQADTIVNLREAVCEYGEKLLDKEQEYEKVCDDTIVGDWHRMIALIGQAVIKCLTASPVGEFPMTTEVNEYTEGIQRLAQDMQAVGGGLPNLLLQRYIWYRLHNDIFQGQQPVWSGPVIGPLTKLFRNLEGLGFKDPKAAEVLSQIKSAIVPKIDAYFGTNEQGIEKCIDDIVRDLAAFATEDTEHVSFRRYVSDIVRLANELRVTMMKSKALFRIGWPNIKGCKGSSIPENDVHFCYSEWTTKKEEREVLHVISPALLKCGLADGYGFENRAILAGARVAIAEPKTEEEIRRLERNLEAAKARASGGAEDTDKDKRECRKKSANAMVDEDDEDDTVEESSHGSPGSNWSTDP